MRNFRDLSYLGLKPGMICRSDVLYKLSFKDKRFLKKEHNVRIVIDLRRKEEIKRLKDSHIFRVKRLHIPLACSEIKYIEIKGLKLSDMTAFYSEFVQPSKKEIWTKLFNLFLEDNNKGILYHCSSGKDRTGVLTAVLLTVLGFDKQTIYEDYLLTNKSPLYYKEYVLEYDEETRNVMLDYFQAKKEYLDITFNEIDRIYGSMNNFLKECCSLDEEKIKKLKRKYLPDYKEIEEAVNTPTSELSKKAPWND